MLAARLEAGLEEWTKVLNVDEKEEARLDLSMDTDAPVQQAHKPGGDPQLRVRGTKTLDSSRL